MKDLLNCPNCGAPIQKDWCPYCGAVFLDWASFDVNQPTFVRIKDRQGNFRLVKLAIYSIHEQIDYDSCQLYADSKVYHYILPPTWKFEAEFEALPFRHYLNPDKDVLEILIDPKKADHQLVNDILQKGFN